MTTAELIEITKQKVAFEQHVKAGHPETAWKRVAHCLADDLILLKGRYDSVAGIDRSPVNTTKTTMEPINEVYSDRDEWCGWSDYNPMLQSFGYKILVQKDQKSYSGDSWLLFKDNARYGYLCFGWGSCSGCDALQACKTLEEVDELRHSIHNSIQWFDTLAGCQEYIKTCTENVHWYSGEEAFEEFIEEVQGLANETDGKCKYCGSGACDGFSGECYDKAMAEDWRS